MASYSRAWPGLVVTSEPVVIPYRLYNLELSQHAIAGLNHLEAS
jgi:hypothetical protein